MRSDAGNIYAPEADVEEVKARAVRGFAALALRYGTVLLINLAGSILVLRLVGPRLWGVYTIAQFVYLSSQVILSRGVVAYLIKKSRPPAEQEVKTTIALQNAIGFSLLVVVLLLASPASRWYDQPELVPFLTAAGIACYSFAWRGVPLALLERGLKYNKIAAIEIVEALLFNLIAGAAIAAGYAVFGLSAALVVRALLPTLVAWWLFPAPLSLRWDPGVVSEMSSFGFFFAGFNLTAIALSAVPPLVVGSLAGAEPLAYVQLSFSLYANLLFVSAAILRVSFSAYSRLAGNPRELHSTVGANADILAATLVPAIALFAGSSPLWIPFIFGEAWKPVSALLLAEAPAYFLAAVFWSVVSSALLVSGKHREMLLLLAAFAAAYAVLAVALTPSLGALGVALAWSAVHLLFYPVLLNRYTRSLGALSLQKYTGQILVGLAMASATWLLAARGLVAPAALVALGSLVLWILHHLPTVRLIREHVYRLSQR